MPRRVRWAVLAALIMTACAAFERGWVPRGGGAVDKALLRQDEDRCRRESTGYERPILGPPAEKLDTKRYETCMRAAGWVRPGE